MNVRRTLINVIVCTIAIVVGTTIAYGETVSNYNTDATLSYASENFDTKYKNKSGKYVQDCVEFAKRCVQAGGVPKDSDRVFSSGKGYTVSDYVEYLIDNGYAQYNKLTIEEVYLYKSGPFYYIPETINAGIVSPGDIIVYECNECGELFHLSICAPADKEGTYAGYYRVYAQKVAQDNKILCAINCSKCKADRTNTSMYALHITSADNGFVDYRKTVSNAKVECTDYNKLKVSWNAVEGAEGYNVYIKVGTGFWTKVAYVTENFYTHTVPQKSYAQELKFKVAPCNMIDSIHYIGKKCDFVTGYIVANSVTNVKLSLVEYRSVKASWTAAKGATGYKVEYKPAGSSKYSFLKWTTSTSATRYDLAAGKKITFKITPYTTSKGYTGKRLSDNVVYKSVYTMKKVSQPKIKRISSSKVKVSWSNISGETGYQISRAKSKTATNVVYTKGSSSLKSATITAKKGVKYYYKVRAYKVENGKRVYAPWSTTRYF